MKQALQFVYDLCVSLDGIYINILFQIRPSRWCSVSSPLLLASLLLVCVYVIKFVINLTGLHNLPALLEDPEL
jgi:hypothetical protein